MTPIPYWADIRLAFEQNASIAAFVAAAMVFSAIPLVAPAIRTRGLLLTIGVLGAVGFYRQAFIAFAVLAILTYLAGLAITRRPVAATARWSRWRVAGLAMIVAVALFVALQLVASRGGIHGADAFIGAMLLWNVIRVITFIWEIGSGRVPMPAPRLFCLWIMFPFALFGPVIRLSEFSAQLDRIQPGTERQSVGPWLADTVIALSVIAAGIILAGLTVPLNAQGVSGKLVVSLIAAPWSFLFQAGGFFRAMEVLARPWNVTLLPSFNRPFGRPNISEFWANWNMTVTSVFRDYLFYNRWGRRRPNVYVNTLILFVLVGAWHSVNQYWVIWGMIHGIGFCVYLWYKKHGTRLHGLFRGKAGRAVAIIATYLFVVGAWALPPQVVKLWRLIQ